jgi:lipopolysaccharide assembly outer membrane protein LptD (OstA)
MILRALAAAALVALAACNPKAPSTVTPKPSLSPGATPSPVALRISGHGTEKQPVRFVETKQNRKQFEILTRSFQSKGAAGNAVLSYDDVKIAFYGKDGSVLNATAPEATVDQRSNLVVMSGGVHAHNSAGVTLQCDTLTYDRSTEMIHGDGNVVITNPNGFRGSGNHFDSNVALTDAKMQ